MRSPRYWTVILILAATAMVLHTRGDKDYTPPRSPLNEMPKIIDSRTAIDQPMEAEVLAVLGAGDFLNRVYVNSDTSAQAKPDARAPISLFIGYFPSQRTGQTIHSPQHCLPGAGWTFESSQHVNMQDDAGKSQNVGEYIINNGQQRQFVVYWYQAHGRSIADEYIAKLYMIADAIRLNRTDGALVRVITPIAPSEGVADARQRTLRFASRISPMLPQFIPN